MPIVKFHSDVLDSTLWMDPLGRDVYLTAVLMAESMVFDREQPQIAVRPPTLTGWSVPPGWYGFVQTEGPMIVKRALIPDMDQGLKALERLCAPDDRNPCQAHGGRRLARIAGGYVVLDYSSHRKYDRTAAERKRRQRARLRIQRGPQPNDL